MKLTCKEVKILLPFYVKNELNSEWMSLVEEHIEGCADCRSEWNKLKNNSSQIETDSKALSQIESKLQRRQILSKIIPFAYIILSGIMLFVIFLTPRSLSHSEAIDEILEEANGEVTITLNERVNEYSLGRIPSENHNGQVYKLVTQTTLWQEWFDANEIEPIHIDTNAEHVVSIYFYERGEENLLLYGEQQLNNEELNRKTIGVWELFRAIIILSLAIGMLILFRWDKNVLIFSGVTVLFCAYYIYQSIML